MTKANEDRMRIIEKRLTRALELDFLRVIDDSHLHVGHVGAQSGMGHFTVEISGASFLGLSRVRCHRLIYDALGDLMSTDIHALRIKLLNFGSRS